jgi:hypothetical protein
MSNNMFYYISEARFLICDIELSSKSVRTFDMLFFDLANNDKLFEEVKTILNK